MIRRTTHPLLGIIRAAEIEGISRLGSASLREAAEALIAKGSAHRKSPVSLQVTNAITRRALTIQADLHPWDLVSVIRAEAWTGCSVSSELTDAMEAKLSHLSPKHLLDLLSACESVHSRPRSFYKSLLARLVHAANTSLLADELVNLFRIIARHNTASAELVSALGHAILNNSSLCDQLKYLHCCEIIGSLTESNPNNSSFVNKLVDRSVKSLDLMPMEELWRTITFFPRLEFSHTLLEREAKSELAQRLNNPILSTHVFDEVSRPIDFIQFLRHSDLLTEPVLIQACKWANDAVYREATRTQNHRRPSIFEVALLADLCKLHNISQETIRKAVTVTVKSLGGTVTHVAKPKPLRYRKGRVYVRAKDGYDGIAVCAVKREVESNMSSGKHMLSSVAFAPKLRASGEALWKIRSGGWYFRK